MSRSLLRSSSLIATLCFLSVATASVRVLPYTQTLEDPADPGSLFFGGSSLAIDGDSIIVLSGNDTSRYALLYRRGSDGRWLFERRLLEVPRPTNGNVRVALSMKNFIAVIKLNEVVTIWEKQNGDWVQAATDGEIRQPGNFAISTNRVLIGADGCTDDALLYQKSATTGRWGITGRVPRQAGVCNVNQARDVELNYDNALVRTGNVLRGYRRSGSNVAWSSSFSLNLPEGTEGPPAMQKDVIVMPGGNYYRLTSSGITRIGSLVPLDAANGAGGSFDVLFRDSVLLTTEWTEGYRTVPQLYAWVQNASGGFDHVAVLSSEISGSDFDISHNTVVVGNSDYFGYGHVTVIELPAPLQAPRPYANNFETSDLSQIDQPGARRFVTARSDDLRNTVLR